MRQLRGQHLPPGDLADSGASDTSCSRSTGSEWSADGRWHGGKEDIAVSLVSWARVSLSRRFLRGQPGAESESRDTAFFIVGPSRCEEQTRPAKLASLYG